MTRKNLLIFDLDGTLVDSRRDIAVSLNAGLLALGERPRALEALAPFIGKPLVAIFAELLGDRTPSFPRAEQAAAAYREHYFAHCADESRLYPGVAETLADLRERHLLAIATTKKTFMAERVAELLGLSPLFDAVLGTDDIPYKPDPTILRLLLTRFGVGPEKAVMVGDTRADLLAAKAAGVRAVAVAYGIGAPEELAACAPEATLARFAELPAVLEGWGLG